LYKVWSPVRKDTYNLVYFLPASRLSALTLFATSMRVAVGVSLNFVGNRSFVKPSAVIPGYSCSVELEFSPFDRRGRRRRVKVRRLFDIVFQ
jgi:hypothetical protein